MFYRRFLIEYSQFFLKLVNLKTIKAFDSITSDQYGSIIMDNYRRSGCQMEIEDAITTGSYDCSHDYI